MQMCKYHGSTECVFIKFVLCLFVLCGPVMNVELCFKLFVEMMLCQMPVFIKEWICNLTFFQ